MKMRVEEAKKIPDDMLTSAVVKRLEQADCRVNGWVIAGFPINQEQLLNLKTRKIHPTLVVEFDQSLEASLHRLGNRKVDPITGQSFNLASSQPSNEAQA